MEMPSSGFNSASRGMSVYEPRTRDNQPSWFESLFVIAALSVFIQAYTTFPARALGMDSGVNGRDPFNAAAMGVVLVMLAILFLTNWRRCMAIAISVPLLLTVPALALASIAWSVDPWLSAHRATTLSEEIAFAFYLAARFRPTEVVRLAAIAYVVAAFVCAAVALAVPSLGVMTGTGGLGASDTLAGAWRGTFSHKNGLGGAMAVGCLCCGWLWLHGRRSRLWAAGFLLCVAVAIKSRSDTGLLGIMTLPVFLLIFRVLRRGRLARLWVVYGIVLASAVAVPLGPVVFAHFTAAMGRTAGLTGRVPLWQAELSEIPNLPVLGDGFGAFWSEKNQAADRISATVHYQVPEAHEAYLDLILQLGAPGLLLCILIVLLALVRSLARTIPLPWGDFAGVYLLLLIQTGFAESVLFAYGTLHLLLLPFVFVTLSPSYPVLAARMFEATKSAALRREAGRIAALG